MPLEVASMTSQEQRSFASGSFLLIYSPKLSLCRPYALSRSKKLSWTYIQADRILVDWGHSCFSKWHCYFPFLLWHHNYVLQFPLWLGGEIWGGHVHLPCVWCGSETCPWVPQGVSTICNKPDVSGANLPAITVSFLLCCPLLLYFLAAPWIFMLSNDGQYGRYRLLASASTTFPEEQSGTFLNLIAFGTAGHSCCRLFSHSAGKGKKI